MSAHIRIKNLWSPVLGLEVLSLGYFGIERGTGLIYLTILNFMLEIYW